MSEGGKANGDTPFRVGAPPARPGEKPTYTSWEFQPEDLKKLDITTLNF